MHSSCEDVFRSLGCTEGESLGVGEGHSLGRVSIFHGANAEAICVRETVSRQHRCARLQPLSKNAPSPVTGLN